jgi:hypothetical protein
VRAVQETLCSGPEPLPVVLVITCVEHHLPCARPTDAASADPGAVPHAGRHHLRRRPPVAAAVERGRDDGRRDPPDLFLSGGAAWGSGPRRGVAKSRS